MTIDSLNINSFKNYINEKFVFSKQINGIIGANGVGKTNILDAIYFLSLTKSRFNMTDTQLINDGNDFFRLDSQFEINNTSIKLVIKKSKPISKVVEWNKAPYEKLRDHIGKIPVVFVIPDDTRLVADFSDTRRKELDLVLSQINKSYLANLMKYNKILKHRNALLKNFHKQKDPSVMLDYYDQQLVLFGKEIFSVRKEFVESWVGDLSHFYSLLSNEKEEVKCMYQSSLESSDLAIDLDRYRDKDILLKRTSFGIHKDDLIFTINGKALKKFGSQGQMKSFVLAIKLAFYNQMSKVLKQKPILLLDDIFDKLDYNRVKNLVNLLQDNAFGQIFISDSHIDRLASILVDGSKDFKIFEILDGQIKSEVNE